MSKYEACFWINLRFSVIQFVIGVVAFILIRLLFGISFDEFGMTSLLSKNLAELGGPVLAKEAAFIVLVFVISRIAFSPSLDYRYKWFYVTQSQHGGWKRFLTFYFLSMCSNNFVFFLLFYLRESWWGSIVLLFYLIFLTPFLWILLFRIFPQELALHYEERKEEIEDEE